MRRTAFELFYADFDHCDGPIELDVAVEEWRSLSPHRQKYWQRVAEMDDEFTAYLRSMARSAGRTSTDSAMPYHSSQIAALAPPSFFHPQAATSCFRPPGVNLTESDSMRSVEGWDVRLIDALLNDADLKTCDAIPESQRTVYPSGAAIIDQWIASSLVTYIPNSAELLKKFVESKN